MQENRAVYADTPAAPAQGHATTGRRANPTISVPAATANRASHSAPGPSASAPALLVHPEGAGLQVEGEILVSVHQDLPQLLHKVWQGPKGRGIQAPN